MKKVTVKEFWQISYLSDWAKSKEQWQEVIDKASDALTRPFTKQAEVWRTTIEHILDKAKTNLA